ncbi:MAG: hypothetical protein LAO04_07345 [Acidobacteriia bacterium]|nr:hypothetical protein [Terriglobia bacterium]
MKGAVAAAAGLITAPLVPAQTPRELPTIAFGSHRVTRLISGGNPLYGYSHFNGLLDNLMREYFSDEQVVKYLLACEKAGINAWQSNYPGTAQRQFPKIRDAGCKMHWICLADPWDVSNPNDAKTLLQGTLKCASIAAKVKPIGIAHHGAATDHQWAAGSIDLVCDFLNQVHDLGFPAGISTHNPAVVEHLESKGWPIDFYMGCFYRVTRTAGEFKKEIGMPPVGETYLATDPDRMTRVLRQAKPVCLGFKILAAGRHCDSPQEVRHCFAYAFKNLKASDAVIVGMFPKFSDQITENVEHVRAVLA